jgi:peptidyl-prolyl cis-trans isomerase D
MALIGTIRKNTWILVVLIAVGMGGFILQSVVSGSRQYASGDNFTIGKVNGEKIDYREFEQTERILYQNSNSDNVYANKSNLWNYFKNKTLTETLAEDMGLGVSTEELLDLEFGQDLSPIITSRFKNQQTGQVDRSQLDQIKKLIDDDQLNKEYKQFWAIQEKEIIYDRLKTKMSNMVAKAIYTPKWYAEESYNLDESKADFNYVKVPFDKVNDDEVEVTDKDIQAYINKHKNLYTNDEEKKVLKYIVIDVKPTEKDINSLKSTANQLVQDFKTSENDSLFAITHDGVYTNIYYKYEDLPEQLKADSIPLNIGTIIGPYKENGTFTIAKILDKKLVPDSVKARHILRSVQQGDKEGYAKAKATIDSLKTLLEAGKESFDSLAVKFSQDPGSSSKGGDLGTFAQGRMVGPFNDACFNGEKDKYYIVNTRFGVHLIKIEDQIFNDKNPKYKVAYVTVTITPSQETQDSIYEAASELLTNNSTIEALEDSAKTMNFEVKQSIPLKSNDYTFMGLGGGQTSRSIIKWAFEDGTEEGDIAPEVYSYTNKKHYYNEKYVIVMLDAVYPEGIRSVDDARKDVEMIVKNKLKGKKIAEMIKTTDISGIASQFSIKVDTAVQVVFKNKFINNLGNEPKVISYAFNGEKDKVYGPSIGNSGVFMVKPLLVQPPAIKANVVNVKKTMTDKVRNEINYRLLNAIAKNVKIEDRRSKFF